VPFFANDACLARPRSTSPAARSDGEVLNPKALFGLPVGILVIADMLRQIDVAGRFIRFRIEKVDVGLSVSAGLLIDDEFSFW
jgi:hypothetical protein